MTQYSYTISFVQKFRKAQQCIVTSQSTLLCWRTNSNTKDSAVVWPPEICYLTDADLTHEVILTRQPSCGLPHLCWHKHKWCYAFVNKQFAAEQRWLCCCRWIMLWPNDGITEVRFCVDHFARRNQTAHNQNAHAYSRRPLLRLSTLVIFQNNPRQYSCICSVLAHTSNEGIQMALLVRVQMNNASSVRTEFLTCSKVRQMQQSARGIYWEVATHRRMNLTLWGLVS